MGGEHEPGPAVGGLGVTDLRGGPAEGLFEQPEGVFQVQSHRRAAAVEQAHNRVRAIGERGNSLLKMTFKALRNVSLNPTSELGKPHNVRECVPASDDHRGDGALQDVLFIRNVQLVHGQPDT